MSKELQASAATGLTLYALLFKKSSGQVWNGTTFVTQANTIGTYAITITEEVLLTQYTGSFPTLITTPGKFRVEFRKRIGGSPATTDPLVWTDEIDWSGSAVIVPVVTDTSGRVTTTYGMHKNTAFTNFEFPMVLTSDHVTSATGKTITGTVSIDGGAFIALTNSGSIVEIGATGKYKIDLAAADLNGTYILLNFTASACDPTSFGIITQL